MIVSTIFWRLFQFGHFLFGIKLVFFVQEYECTLEIKILILQYWFGIQVLDLMKKSFFNKRFVVDNNYFYTLCRKSLCIFSNALFHRYRQIETKKSKLMANTKNSHPFSYEVCILNNNVVFKSNENHSCE